MKIKTVDQDRYGWIREATFGEKIALETPVFASIIKGKTEFDTYIDFMSAYKARHLNACLIPVIVAKSTTEYKIEKLKELK